jgi:hypothetical protein
MTATPATAPMTQLLFKRRYLQWSNAPSFESDTG